MPLTHTARLIVENLGLQPHPEGGYYKVTFRSDLGVSCSHKPLDTDSPLSGERRIASAILYLLSLGDVSVVHRIDGDEMWHLYEGGRVKIVEFDDTNRQCRTSVLGSNSRMEQTPQYLVRRGKFFGAYLDDGVEYALMGCTVAPEFQFGTFEVPDRQSLMDAFPSEAEIIKRLTRP